MAGHLAQVRSREISVIASVGQVSAHAPHDDARRVAEALVQPGGDVGVEAAAGRGQRERALDLVARAHAAPARDAQLVLEARGTGGARRARARGARRASAARRRRACARPRQLGVLGRRVAGSSDSTSSTTAVATRRAVGVGRVDLHAVAHAASCTRRPGRARPRRRPGRRGTRRTAPGARRSTASGSRAAARTASSTVVPGATVTCCAVDLERDHCEPQLLGEVREQAADRRRHAAAVRAQAAELERLEQLLEPFAVDRRRRSRTSSCARRSPIRHGKHLPQLSAAPKCSRCLATRAHVGRARRRRRSRRGRPCSPRRRAASKSNTVSSCERGQDARRAGRRSAAP